MLTPDGALQKRGGLFAGTAFRRPALAAFLCSLAVAAAFILPFILRGGGLFYVSNDYVYQQIPFSQEIVKRIHSGDWFYDFNLDLGSGLIEGYAYYGLGSIFSWLLLLFPAAATPWLMGPLLILKYGVAGWLCFLWARRYTGTDLAALLCGLLYAFSGIAISNMVFQFADAYALFPLLPLGMDRLWEQRRTGLFALAVALNALANPPLFFGAALFMVLYFAAKVLWKSYAFSWKSFGLLAAETACGIALTAFLMVPFVASLAASPRVEGTLPFGKAWFFYIAYPYFKILRALVTPGEVIHSNTMFLETDLVSPELYLPMFALVLCFAYVLGKKRDWLRALLIASLVCMLVPVLNSAFNAFNQTYYTRWLYAPVMMAALASVLALEQPAIRLGRGFALWGAFAAGLLICMGLWYFYYDYHYIVSNRWMFLLNLALCLAGLAATAFSRRLWKNAPRLLALGVALFAIVGGGANLAVNQNLTGTIGDLPRKALAAAESVTLPEGTYRISAPIQNVWFDHGSPFSFNTTVPAGVFQLQGAFGRQRTATSRIEYDEPGLWSLLGVKYLLVSPNSSLDMLPNLALYAGGSPYAVAENLDALPLVIGFDAAIAADDAEGLDNTQKSIALLHGLVLDEATAATLGLEALPAEALAGLDYTEGVAARKAMAASEVTLGSAEVTAEITIPTGGAALITLPYDTAWRCTVDGAAAELVRADWGLMAVKLPAGQHTLTLRYRPPGFALGLALTGIGLAGLALLLLQNKTLRAPPSSTRRGKKFPPDPHR